MSQSYRSEKYLKKYIYECTHHKIGDKGKSYRIKLIIREMKNVEVNKIW